MKRKATPKPEPVDTISADDARRLLAANRINLAKKVKSGKTLSAREVALLKGATEPPAGGIPFEPGDIVAGMSQAAAVLGVNKQAVRAAKAAGCLAFKANNNVHVPTLRKWIEEHDGDPEGESVSASDKRYKTGKADRMEIIVLEMRKKLIPEEIVKRVMTRLIIAFKARVMIMPDNFAQRFAVMTDPIEIRETMRQACVDALTELAKCEWSKEAPPANG